MNGSVSLLIFRRHSGMGVQSAFLAIFFCLLTDSSTAQPRFGNEWIRPGQTYYKMPVAKPGRYRLTTADLIRANLPVASLPPAAVQLFWRGVEQPLRIVGEADGRFDAGDYLEFTGQGNDGAPDSLLYSPHSAQPHPYYSLFSDTTAYFLTWRTDGGTGLRLPPDTTQSGLTRPVTDLRLFTQTYPAGTIYPLGAGYADGAILSSYDVGEGWTGPVISPGQSFTQTFTLVNPAPPSASTPIRMTGLVVGRNSASQVVVVRIGPVGEPLGVVDTLRFEGYHTRLFSHTLPQSYPFASPLVVTCTPLGGTGEVSVSYLKLGYPQRTDGPLLQPAIFTPTLQPVAFRVINAKKAQFIIITHPLLREAVGPVTDPVRAYAAYRASLAGGSFDTLTVDIGQLFDQFSYGERTPLAIRRFADYLLTNGNPRFLLLIGQSRDPQAVRHTPKQATLDMVPNWGWPGSDLGLVAGLNHWPAHVPALPLGRLNASSAGQVRDYLQKVQQHETPDADSVAGWRKRVLHLSGGRSAIELARFWEYVDGFASHIAGPFIGAQVATRSKQTDAPVEEIPVADLVNEGVGLLTMFGHSSLDITDLDIGFASDDRRGYRNRGRYPLLFINGCAIGNFYFGRPTLTTDWVLAPNRGAIAAIAHTFNGFPHALQAYTDQFYQVLADSAFVGRAIGDIQQETIRQYLAHHQSTYDITNAQQITLQGDPAIRPFPFTRPDFAWAAVVKTPLTDSLSHSADSLRIVALLLNQGKVIRQAVTVRIRQYAGSGQLMQEVTVDKPTPFFADTLQLVLPKRAQPADGYLELVADANDAIPEEREMNNRLVLNQNGQPATLPFAPDRGPPLLEVAIDGRQIQNNDFVAAQPTIEVLVLDENLKLIRQDTTDIDMYLQHPCPTTPNCPYQRLSLRTARYQPADATNAFRLMYQPPTPWYDGRYTLDVRVRDLSGNQAAPYQIHFRVQHQPALLAAPVYPNPMQQQTHFGLTVMGATPPEAVEITIRDVRGQLVCTLRPTPHVGTNAWHWDGRSDAGELLPNGLYLYHIAVKTAGEPLLLDKNPGALTGKLILAR